MASYNPSTPPGRRSSAAWYRPLALALICLLVPGCSLNLSQVMIPLAYAGIGTCIALLVSPSLTAALLGCVLGGIIGAAVYNNSLKADLMERQDWHRGVPDETAL